MGEVVKIVAKEAFDYSHDNGVTLLRYEPGQIYEIPSQSIEGLRRRNAIEILDRQKVDEELSKPVAAGAGAELDGEGSEAGEGADDGEGSEAGEGADDGGDAADKSAAKPSKPNKPSKPAK